MVFVKHKPKLLLSVNDKDQEDAGIVVNVTDRIPSVLCVRWFDLFCFLFAMVSYALDLFTDVGIAILHIVSGRVVSGCTVLTFALLPSIIINIISLIWMLDDEMHWKRKAHPRRNATIELERKRFLSVPAMVFLCVVQMGPLFWYFKAYHYGKMFRKNGSSEVEKRKFFSKMVEAERDATYLRFFEAYLESAPQLIVQGSIVTTYLWNNSNESTPLWLYYQAVSILISIISISWSVVVQNRSLRMIRDDKVNIWPHEAILQFCWRFLTIFARISVLCLAVMMFGSYILLFIFTHLVLSMVHVILLQAVFIEQCTMVEKLLLVINTLIHVFTPFNMAEGNTRYRYLVAYTIEFIEMMLVMYFASTMAFKIPLIDYIQYVIPTCFLIGIAIMCTYYKFFHPNRRQHQENESTENTEVSQQSPTVGCLLEPEASLETMKMAGCLINAINEVVLDC